MADQYVEAAGEERFEMAVATALRLCAEREELSVEQAAAAAVIQEFCLCVTDANDQMEHQLSPIHTALIAEVTARVAAEVDRRPDDASAPTADAGSETFCGAFGSFGSARMIAPSERR